MSSTMLHVIHQRSWDFDSSYFGAALIRAGVTFRSFSAVTDMRYRTVASLLLRIYPKLVWTTLRLGVRSLVLARPRPDVILVSTEIEGLLIGLMRRLVGSRALVVLQTLIVTPRKSPMQRALHRAYWWCVLRMIDFGTVHSQAEAESYRSDMPGFAGRFVFVPYGMSVIFRGKRAVRQAGELPVVVTAGRSGRDYSLLVRAVAGLPCRLVIICDKADTVAGLPQSDQVTVLRDCFDQDYLQKLASADLVVIPLSVNDISAGQMVYLQAAALGRAVVMTATSTSVEYATDGEQAVLVPRGDEAALRAAICAVLAEPARAARLGAAAQARFKACNSTEAYVRHLLAAIHGHRPGVVLASSERLD